MSLNKVQQLGQDNLSNHFEFILTPYGNLPESLFLGWRVTSVDMPDTAVETYTYHVDGDPVEIPSGINGNPTEFSFTFRNDRANLAYTAIRQWIDDVKNDQGLLGVNFFRRPISILGRDGNGLITHVGWQVSGAFPKNIAGVTFDEESGEPIAYQVTMSFVTCKSRQTVGL